MNTRLVSPGRTRRPRTPLLPAAVLVTIGLTIAGCTPTASDARPAPSSSASATPTETPVPSAEPSIPADVAPTASPNASPSPSPSASAAPAPIATPPASTYTEGCAPNNTVIPAGAETSLIDDVDFDGRADTQFFAEEPDFLYGISTASGATYTLRTDLAGPGKHSGWTATLESGLVVTVLDDSRTATLHTFVNCAFQTTTTADGERLSIDLTGGMDNQGVQCSSGNGGRWLNATRAARIESGLFTISSSSIDFNHDGTTATISAPAQVATDVPADDPQVALATQSRCGDTPKVATSGR
jgi:hypothetical protein